jgi:hypothetical protein
MAKAIASPSAFASKKLQTARRHQQTKETNMANMLQHESNNIVKLLLLGDSGAGKTGALASLVDAGMNIRVLDFDNGLSVLKGYVRDKTKLANVHYQTLRDDFQLLGARMGIKRASAFQQAMELLEKGGDKWGESGKHIPPLVAWTPRDVLVIDSLSLMGKSSLMMVMQANGAAMKAPEIQHYGTAMDNIEKFLDLITSSSVPCHVIVNTHTSSPDGSTKIYPEALGSKLGPKVPKPFDTMLSLSIKSGERVFNTEKDGLLALKSAKKLAPTYPISTGLLDIFKALTGKTNLAV